MSNPENIRSNNKMGQGAQGFGGSGMKDSKPGPRRGGPLGFGGPGGGHGVQMQGEKAKNFKGTMAKFVKYISEFKAQVIIVFIFAVASTIFAIVGPKILGKATTRLFEGVIGNISGTGTGIDFKYIGTIVLISVGLYPVSYTHLTLPTNREV